MPGYDSRESEDDFGDNNANQPSKELKDRVQRASEQIQKVQQEERVVSSTKRILEVALRNFLKLYPELPQESIENTPSRWVKALSEMTSGHQSSPEEILGKVFDVQCDEIIILKDIAFTSLCEHHVLPFSGTVDIGYIPGKVVGLSKLARLVDCFSQRLQIQEKLTREIGDSIMKYLDAKGVAVVTKASHSCMSCRGIKKSGATMICSNMQGVFMTESAARAEFLQLCR